MGLVEDLSMLPGGYTKLGGRFVQCCVCEVAVLRVRLGDIFVQCCRCEVAVSRLRLSWEIYAMLWVQGCSVLGVTR